ncbi:MAG TPA: hypothetical protein VN673_11210 [Clostridia bacterium]|nr:hypothetical protein [Clostridia bacterium]
MLRERDFKEMVQAIMQQGYSEEQASEFAALIGDRPVTDEAGMVLVLRNGAVLARLKPITKHDTNHEDNNS